MADGRLQGRMIRRIAAACAAGAWMLGLVPGIAGAAAAQSPAPVAAETGGAIGQAALAGAFRSALAAAGQMALERESAAEPPIGEAAHVSGNSSKGSAVPGAKTVARAAAKTPGAEAPPLAERVYTPEEEARIAAFYGNTVLAGDSVLLGFRNYCRSGDAVMKGLHFLAAGSLSLHNAFWPVSSKSVHPVWQGEQRPIWESVQMIGADRVFLFFGINDMVYGIEDSVEKYGELIAKIREARPEAAICIISATYMLEGTEKKSLNNENIALFNARMAEEAQANGWSYVDMATPTSDGAGNLHPAYCTDGFLHQTRAAYEVWERVMKDFALAETAES